MARAGIERALLDNVPEALLAIGAGGVIEVVNARALALFAFADLCGRPLDEVLPGATRHLTTAAPERLGVVAQRGDGTTFAAEVTFGDTAAKPLVLLGVRDVTGRAQGEATFRALLEAAPDATIGVASDGNIALVNAQAERLFGYPREELLGQPLEILVPVEARAIHPAHRLGYFADPRPRPMGAGMQLAGRRKDGTEFPAEISLSALDTEAGRIVSAAVRDVTDRIEAQAERERLKAQAERERLEARMHQSQRLESLGQLAGGVAHDFNNLLAVILNYTTFVGDEVSRAAAQPDGAAWEAVRRDVEQVQLAAQRATALTHQLLAFGRREVVQPQSLSLADIVRDVEQLLRRSIGEHVELVIEAAPGLARVMADRGQLEQVLVNIAVNARDAMPDGGTLTIQTDDVDLDQEYVTSRPELTAGRYVRLRISDTGEGMDPDTLRRAFEPFFTTKPKGDGSGLGLATVYGIVTQAGGSARLHAEPGLGTTFTALLPVTAAAAAAAAEPEAPHGSARGETVLVVEDEDALREVTRRILTRHGYAVLTAPSGPDALDAARTHRGRIDLLLTDVVMPQMLGKEVAERFRALRPGTPVLFMSGYAQPVLASHGRLDPDVTLVEKPFTEAALLSKVRDVLDPRVRR